MTFLGQSKIQRPVAGGAGIQQPVPDSPWSQSSFHSPGFLSSLAVRVPAQEKGSLTYISSSRYNSFCSLTCQFSPTSMVQWEKWCWQLRYYILTLSAPSSRVLNLILEKKCYQKGHEPIENRGTVWEVKFSSLTRDAGTELTEMTILHLMTIHFMHS